MIPDDVKPFVIRKVQGYWVLFTKHLPLPYSFITWDHAMCVVDRLSALDAYFEVGRDV